MAIIERALDVASKVVPSIFPIGRFVKVVRYGAKVPNSSSPIAIAGNITLTDVVLRHQLD